jgi:hypothetical protein
MPDSLPDREPRDHGADDPVHDGCAVLDAQQQQQQQQACHKASAFGTPARAANGIKRLRIRTRCDVEMKFIIGAGLR